MRNNLTPTTITDVNGRITTVHKRLSTSPDDRLRKHMPAPAISKDQDTTPLTLPRALSDEDFQKFIEWQQEELRRFNFREGILGLSSQRFDPVAEALAWRLAQDGSVPSHVVAMLLRDFHQKHWRKRELNRFDKSPLDPVQVRNSLLLAESIYRHRPALDQKIAPVLIRESLDGYCYRTKQEERHSLGEVKTEEELSSLTAVSVFIADLEDDVSIVATRAFRKAQGTELYGSYILNRSLDAYLRTNPDKAEQVISYVKDRGIGKAVKDTKQMIAWLDNAAGNSAIDQGRL